MEQPSKAKNVQKENRELLRKLIKRGVLELKPTLDDNGFHYAEVEEIWRNTDPADIRSTLQSLEKIGALKSKVYEQMLICPGCSSPRTCSLPNPSEADKSMK